MNPICEFCLHESCRSSNECVNKHEKLSFGLGELGLGKKFKLSKDNTITENSGDREKVEVSTITMKMEDNPSIDFGDADTTRKQVQQASTIESTIEPTIEPTTVIVNDECKNAGPESNKLNKTKSIREQLEEDLKALKIENAELNGKVVTLETSTILLTQQLKEEKNKNAKLAEEFNIELLDNEDYQCCICREIFIRPSLFGCSHMFCEWCIDKWLEKYNHCPTCRIQGANYTLCLNMNNLILRKMELMPAEIRLAYKDLEEARAKEKQISIQIHAERRRLEFITRTLNERRPS